MAGLLLLLLVGVALSPTGVSISVSPGGLPLGARVVLAVFGFLVASFPPALMTYLWYLKRLRAWGEAAPAADRPVVKPPSVVDPATQTELGELRERVMEIEERMDVMQRLLTEFKNRQELPRP